MEDVEGSPFRRLRDLHGTRAVVPIVGLMGFVLVGAMAVLVRALHHQVIVGDEARLAIQAFESVTTHPRLGVLTTAGQYSGRDLNNPGPIQLYTLLPFVRIFGLEVGSWIYCTVVIGTSIVVSWWAAFRVRGWWAAAVVAFAFPYMLLNTNAGALTHVLNDELVLAPMFACWILCWSVSSGDSLMLPPLAIAATFVVQTFVGDAYLVMAPVLIAVVGFGWAIRGRRVTHPWRSIATTVVVLAMLWAPPLVDELTETRNLSGLLSFSAGGRGWSGVWNALGAIFSSPTQPGNLHPPSIVGVVIVLIAVAWLGAAARRGMIGRSSWPICLISVSVVGASCVTAAISPPSDNASYHLLWARSTCWLLLAGAVVVGGGALARSPHRSGERARSALSTPTACWVAVALVVVEFLRFGVQPPADGGRLAEARSVRSLSAQLSRQIPRGRTRWIVDRGGSESGDITHGIRALLRSSGRDLEYGYDDTKGTSMLVVVPEELSDHGRPVARTEPTRTKADRDFPEALAQWAQHAGRLTLTPSGHFNLLDRVDGSAPVVCPKELRRDPSTVRRLPPESLALIVAEDEIASPAIPPALVTQAAAWRYSNTYRIYDLPIRGRAPFDEPFLSKSSC